METFKPYVEEILHETPSLITLIVRWDDAHGDAERYKVVLNTEFMAEQNTNIYPMGQFGQVPMGVRLNQFSVIFDAIYEVASTFAKSVLRLRQ